MAAIWLRIASLKVLAFMVFTMVLTGLNFVITHQTEASSVISSSQVAPLPPSNLRVRSNGTSDQLILTWQDNSSNEQGFTINRYVGAGDWEEIARVGANVTSYVDRGLRCGVVQEYWVDAFNNAGYSRRSNTSQDSPGPCSSPQPTPTAVASQALLSVRDVQWQSPMRAMEATTLNLTVSARNLPPQIQEAGYVIRIQVGKDFPYDYLDYWIDSTSTGDNIDVSPNKLTNDTMSIRVSGLRFPIIFSGFIQVTVWHKKGDVEVTPSVAKPFQVSSSDRIEAAGTHCWLAGFMLAQAFAVGTEASLEATDRMILTNENIKRLEDLDRCGGNKVCQDSLMDRHVEENATHWVEKLSQLNSITEFAIRMKKLAEGGINAAKCYLSLRDIVTSFVKKLNIRGKIANLAFTESPVYPLVVNFAGQRAGFLENGQAVTEIPGSEVFAIEDHRFVVFEGQGAVQLKVTGYAAGTMNLKAVLATGNSSAVSLEYNNVPVSAGMVATVGSSDPQATLNIDINRDGRPDQTKAPNVRETIGNSAPGRYTFKETGFAVDGRFWQIWQGGRSFEDSLYINGFPITSLRPEVSTTDGKTYQTQWFERARFEQHTENQAPHDVLLGLLGVNAAKGRQNETPFKPVVNPGGAVAWFRETQHTLGDTSEGGRAIAAYWNRLGGLSQFGFPISQPFMERNVGDGKTYLVQYFERQRFEYHPEHKGTRYEVLLGRLGAEQMDNNPAPKPSATATPLVVEAQGRIAFSSHRGPNNTTNGDIYVMNADGSGQTRLTNNPNTDRVPSWSPDGRFITYSAFLDNFFEIYVMNADGSGQTRLTNNLRDDIDPSWSPDGSRIAFASYVSSNYEIYTMNADGSGQARLTNNSGLQNDLKPSWSPDGRRIVFESARESDGHRDIYVMNADGSAQTRLTNNPGEDRDPSWSPDGRRIAFQSERDGGWDIYVMNADGSAQTRLTTGGNGDPTWSPDGRRIAFVSGRDGNNEIYVMNADGSGQARLTNDSGSDVEPSWSSK
jgi:hypothetical protein